MINIEYLKSFLLIAIILSTITCTLIQKTKKLLPSNQYIIAYSFIVNIGIGMLFCLTFTNITFPHSIWIGLFSFVGADSIYKSLEGKVLSYTEIRNEKENQRKGLS